MDFVKMHGLGNDFILVQADSWENAAELQKYSRLFCDRHFGIGADGLIVTGRDKDADIFMRIFNPDASEPEMCGNGIRCVAVYAKKQGLVSKNSFAVRTLAGPRFPEIIAAQGDSEKVKVDMGEPVLQRQNIPMKGEGDVVGVEVKAAGRNFTCTAVSMGNPHCIIFVDDVQAVPLENWGPALEKHELFPAAANVEFVQVINDREILVRVWERGAGPTLACGTGACAALVAAFLNGKTGRSALVRLPGGELNIEWSEKNNHVYMTGPAVEVFRGSILPRSV